MNWIKCTAQEIKEMAKEDTGVDFEVAEAAAPTFKALYDAMLKMGHTDNLKLTFFDKGGAIVTLVEGPYHLSVWGGLPKAGRKLRTVTWQGLREYDLIDSQLAAW
jgi:hypothetical protein